MGDKHVHNYILIRTEKSNGKLLKFYECIESGCDNPHHLEVEDDD